MICFLLRLQVKSLSDRETWKEIYKLKNKTYQELYQIEPLPILEQFIEPKGLAYCVVIYHRKRLVGSARLIDLTQSEPIVKKLYHGVDFQYSPSETYEFSNLIIDNTYQGGSRTIFYLLMAYTHWYTINTGRKQWIVSSNQLLFSRLKRMGLPLTFISNQFQLVNDGSSEFTILQNDFQNEVLRDCCCFYAHQPKYLTWMQFKKYIALQFRV